MVLLCQCGLCMQLTSFQRVAWKERARSDFMEEKANEHWLSQAMAGSLMWCSVKISVVFFPVSIICLLRRSTCKFSSTDYLPVSLKTTKVFQNKGHLRSCQEAEEGGMMTEGAVAYMEACPREHMVENRNLSKGCDTSEQNCSIYSEGS